MVSIVFNKLDSVLSQDQSGKHQHDWQNPVANK
jgi:hypothetical protein